MAPTKPFALRSHRPGHIGWIIHRHGVIYDQDYGWNERFEAMVARVAADFIDQYDPSCERCWIAEHDDGTFLGSVFIVKDREAAGTAKMRLLLVEPTARGLGIGSTLVQEYSRLARLVGYARITLWTSSNLTAAARRYKSEGYRVAREEDYPGFGKELVTQDWELTL